MLRTMTLQSDKLQEVVDDNVCEQEAKHAFGELSNAVGGHICAISQHTQQEHNVFHILPHSNHYFAHTQHYGDGMAVTWNSSTNFVIVINGNGLKMPWQQHGNRMANWQL